MIQEINNIKDNLKSISCDFKGEVFANELTLNGISLDDILFKSKSAFKRQFEKEIQSINFEDNDFTGSKIVIELNREGFYDFIPEGITHFDVDKKAFKNSSEITDEIKLKRLQEKTARDFFQPFENEFYSANITLENKESGSVNQFDSVLNKQLFFKTYGYLPEFDDVQIAKLLFFLPLAYKLRGQDRMIEFMLKNLIPFPITAVVESTSVSNKIDFQKKLVDCELGVDSILGDSVKEYETSLILKVSELHRNDMLDFFEGGIYYNIIEKVIGFLMPIDYKLKMIYYFCETDKIAFLHENQEISYLGYNSVI
jgi:hypothetical protein